MTSKKDLRLRVNPKLYDELMRWSAEELRSMNSLVEYLLTDAVKKRNKSFREEKIDEKDE